MAGSELSGPLGASPDLFEGRRWVLTPSAATGRSTRSCAMELVSLCGALPLVMDAAAHDDAVALVSHAPHMVASVLAARLTESTPEAVGLAGRGLRDVLRIAGGDAALWEDVLRTNGAAVARVLDTLVADLRLAAEVLRHRDTVDSPALAELLIRGAAGLAALRGTGAHCSQELTVPLAPGRPAELARLRSALAEFDIGPDDLTVDSSATGGALSARCTAPAAVAERIRHRLTALGWRVRLDGIAAVTQRSTRYRPATDSSMPS